MGVHATKLSVAVDKTLSRTLENPKIIKHSLQRSVHPANRIRTKMHNGVTGTDRSKATALPVPQWKLDFTTSSFLPLSVFWLKFVSTTWVCLYRKRLLPYLPAVRAATFVRLLTKRCQACLAVKYFRTVSKIPLGWSFTKANTRIRRLS